MVKWYCIETSVKYSSRWSQPSDERPDQIYVGVHNRLKEGHRQQQRHGDVYMSRTSDGEGSGQVAAPTDDKQYDDAKCTVWSKVR